MEVNTSDAIAFLSLAVSFGAAIFAKSSSHKANQIARDNLSLQHSMVELEITQSIENAKSKINEIKQEVRQNISLCSTHWFEKGLTPGVDLAHLIYIGMFDS